MLFILKNIQRITLGLFAMLFFGFIIIFPAHSVLALGVSPGYISVNALRNMTQTKTVTIFRGAEDKGDINIEVVPGGKDARFIKIKDNHFVLPVGTNEHEYSFDVNPGNSENGSYMSLLSFLLDTGNKAFTQGAGSRVRTGVTVKIPTTVDGREIIDYKITRVYALDTEINMDTDVFYTIQNLGNTDWRPDKISVSFSDANDGTVVDTVDVIKDQIQPSIAGSSESDIRLSLKPKLIVGTYKVKAMFYDQNKAVGEFVSTNPFSVFPEGTLKQTGDVTSVIANKTKYKVGDKVKLTATFSNTGQVRLNARMFANINRDGEFIDLIRGQEYEIDAGQTITMDQILELSDVGKYSADVYVEYGKRKTDSKTVNFSIEKPSVVGSFSFGESGNKGFIKSVIIGTGIVLLLCIIIVLVKLKKKSKPNSKKTKHVSSVDKFNLYKKKKK